jgi:two-component sensor histidine kinase
VPAFSLSKIIFGELRKLFDTVLNFGIEEQQSPHDKRKIKTINFLNLVMVSFLIIGYTNYFILGSDFQLGSTTSFLFLGLFSLLLSKLKKTNLSFLLFTLNVNLSIFYINLLYPIEAGPYLFYFPLIVSVVLLSRPSFKDKYSLIHLGICMVFFVTALIIDYPDLTLKSVTPQTAKTLWYYDLCMSATITAILSYLLSRLISNQNKEIMAQYDDLKKAKETVNASLKEKEILLAELHHRVKNNMAIISALLNLQEEATENEEAKQIIGDSKARIMSMSLVHKMLYENSELKSINIGKYASELIIELFNSYNLTDTVIVNQDYDKITLSVNKSVPLGLILNELITNSIKYTYKTVKRQDGQFLISIKQHNGQIKMIVRDNGRGFPEGFNPESDTPSLGIYLIKTLAEQIDGEVQFSNDNGAKIELNFSPN